MVKVGLFFMRQVSFVGFLQFQYISIILLFNYTHFCIYYFYLYYLILMDPSHTKLHKLIVLDIGGTLSKICFVTDQQDTTIPHDSRLTIKLPGKTVFFNYFKVVEQCWDFIRKNFNQDDQFQRIIITGGGAFKYSDQLEAISKEIDKKVVVVQEFQGLVGGMSFFRANSKYEEFNQSFVSKDSGQYKNHIVSYSSMNDEPVLVVNIGSGVSILLVQKNEKNELKAQRVGGTSLGGGFFMGLANLLIGENNFHKLLQMAQKGDVNFTDFTPKDFPEISKELSEASVLVSLGKLNNQSNPNDIARSLFFMVTFNIAQIALSYLEIKKLRHVIFTGFYCRDNAFFLQCFTEAFNFFARNSSPKFVYSMVHDGFLGALGALQMELSK